MKRKMIFIVILLFAILMQCLLPSTVQAIGISDVVSGGDSFIEAGKNENVVLKTETLKNTSNVVYNTLLIIGMGVAVIVSGILGIKFMIGSVEEKAQIKDALVPFIIGCIVVFGAFGIWKIAINIGKNLG